MGQLKISATALRGWLNERHLRQTEVSEAIGRDKGFISSCLYCGTMPEAAYRMLLKSYNLTDGSFIPEAKTAGNPNDAPYTMSLQVWPDKVRVGVSHMGSELYHAFARVKGDKELDLIQSISYAAHMIYKIAEQAELRGKKHEL